MLAAKYNARIAFLSRISNGRFFFFFVFTFTVAKLSVSKTRTPAKTHGVNSVNS